MKNVLHVANHRQNDEVIIKQSEISLKHFSTFRTLRDSKFSNCSQLPDKGCSYRIKIYATCDGIGVKFQK